MKKPRSLRLRLFLAAIVTTGIALTIAGFGLAALFERHVARRVDNDLTSFLQRITAHVDIDDETGGLAMQPEPGNRQRSSMPYGGYYWQITDGGKIVRTSRSLWDQTIPPPPDKYANSTDVHRYLAPGPGGTRLVVMHRAILLERPDGSSQKLDLSVAVDNRVISEPTDRFIEDLALSLSLLALVLVVAAGLQISIGLRPLEAVRREITAIRSGDQKKLSDDFPSEVQPLSEELNALLHAQDVTLTRARNRAADLAHGLKTPLTALSGDIRRLREKGEEKLADDIAQAVDMMSRHVGREMARARIRSSGTLYVAKTPVQETLTPLIETLRRTPSGGEIDWRMNIAAGQTIPMDRDDLIECIGNLLENAAHHAETTVSIGVKDQGDHIRMTIEDDGPGIPTDKRERLQERGHSLDQSGNGAGLGLAIVQDLVDAYDARMSLDESRLGGLLIAIDIPLAGTVRK